MHIGVKKTVTQVPNTIVDTKPSVTQGYDWGIKQLGQFTTQNLSIVLKTLSSDLSIYLGKLNQSYNNFLSVNKLKRQINNLSKNHGDQTVAQKISKITTSKFNNNRKATQDFIQVMLEGHELLLYIRAQFTGQSLTTKFTVNTGGKIYTVDNSLISDIYKPVLSTFGGTSGSPFSLAYKLDVQMLEAIAETREGVEEISTSDIYNQIMKIKNPYLQELSIKRGGRKYRPVFNSKDAEIYDLMLQQGYEPKWLTVQRYTQLRASMGGGGGYRTSGIKLGDVGLQQDKYFSTEGNTVNFARYSLIRNNLQNLLIAINQISDPNLLAQTIIKLFTEKKTRVSDSISYRVNEEARKHIQNLFHNF